MRGLVPPPPEHPARTHIQAQDQFVTACCGARGHRAVDVNVASNPAFAIGANDASELEYRRAQTDLALYIENAREETSVDA